MRLLVIVLALAGCRRDPVPANTEPTSAGEPTHPGPPWPARAEEPMVRPGFHWTTLRHETIHVRMVVPDGVTPALTRDGYHYPAIDLQVAGVPVRCQFDSGIGALGATLAAEPPTVYGLVPTRVELDDDHAAVQYLDAQGGLRISGYARGVKCGYHGPALSDAAADAVFAVSASVRSPAPGPWRPATEAERAHGMTAVPGGGWIEGALPSTPGSRLRPGPFVARMYLGALVVQSGRCPASLEALQTVAAPDVEARAERRTTAGVEAWVRQATEAYDGLRYPGATTLYVPRGDRCCIAQLLPWTHPDDAAKIDYAIALCATYRE